MLRCDDGNCFLACLCSCSPKAWEININSQKEKLGTYAISLKQYIYLANCGHFTCVVLTVVALENSCPRFTVLRSERLRNCVRPNR